MTTQSRKQPGLPPGSLVYTGIHRGPVQISVIEFGPEYYNEHDCARLEDIPALTRDDSIHWIDIEGIHDAHLIEQLHTKFGIHPLALEDALQTNQRPKVESFSDHLSCILKMLFIDVKTNKVVREQVSIFLGSHFVITLQEQPGDAFDPVRERLRKSVGKIRREGADYLAYSLLDSVVDYYFQVLDSLHERVEQLEEEIAERISEQGFKEVHELKRTILKCHRSILPLRDAVRTLVHEESSLLKETTRPYLRDVLDHVIAASESIESLKDDTTSLRDLYLALSTNRTNEVMRFLTLISTTFMPLTFLTSVYGMNFEVMPELSWRYGYFMVWVVLVLVTVGLLLFFKKKRWL